jgi:hypothetical protein
VAATTRRRPAAAGPIPGPSMPPATGWGDASAGTILRTADLRSQSAYISLAGHRPMPRRRVVPIQGPAHHQRPDPGSTITSITKVVLTQVPSP